MTLILDSGAPEREMSFGNGYSAVFEGDITTISGDDIQGWTSFGDPNDFTLWRIDPLPDCDYQIDVVVFWYDGAYSQTGLGDRGSGLATQSFTGDPPPDNETTWIYENAFAFGDTIQAHSVLASSHTSWDGGPWFFSVSLSPQGSTGTIAAPTSLQVTRIEVDVVTGPGFSAG